MLVGLICKNDWKQKKKCVPATVCWHGRKHNDPPPAFSLILNNNDNNGFPIVGNEATGKLFTLIFPWRGTRVVTKKSLPKSSVKHLRLRNSACELHHHLNTSSSRSLCFFLLIDGFTLRTVKVSQEAVLSSFTLLFFFCFFLLTRARSSFRKPIYSPQRSWWKLT